MMQQATKFIRANQGGFTLTEMMVAISLLVLIMLGIGQIFSATGKTVGISQAATEMTSNVRAMQTQLQRDLAGLDHNGFLVIRSRFDASSLTPANCRRIDQICFIANGKFPHRTGTASATPMADGSFANSAIVWYGHLVYETTPNQTEDLKTGWLPTISSMPFPDSKYDNSANFSFGSSNPAFTLGRHALLLVPPDGTAPVGSATNVVTINSTPIAAFPYSADCGTLTTANAVATSGETSANICSSRIDAAQIQTSQIMQYIAANKPSYIPKSRFEADAYCFRHKILPNVFASEVSVVNGYFRMTPILLQGVPSFAVEWTDGTVDANGVLNWYGINDSNVLSPRNGSYPATINLNDVEADPNTSVSGDQYTAVFDYNTLVSNAGGVRISWPKALKFSYRVTDPNDRLQGGRVFTQVVYLP